MIIKVYWKNVLFLEIEKIDEKYFSKIIGKNYNIVKSQGCPLVFFEDIKVIDDMLPKIIKDRLPKIENLMENYKKDVDIEKSIFEYINQTKCERATDYITIEIAEN